MKKYWYRIGVVFTLLCLALFPWASAFGDAGGFSGSTDFSSGGYSSGGYSSGGSSWGDSSSYGGSYGGYSSTGSSEPMGPVDVVIIVVVIIFFLLMTFAGSKSRRSGAVQVQDNFDASKLQPIGTLRQIDPKFDPAEISQQLAQLYVDMQHAWTAKDFSPMRPHFSDALFAQFDRQLDSLRRTRRTNYVDDIQVMQVIVDGWYPDGEEERLVARVVARIRDYTVTDADGEVVSGSKTDVKQMTYRWTLSRSAGAKTGECEPTQVSCPNCGAQVMVNQTSKCPYCDSVITVETHDWVITAIQGLEQRTL